MLVRISATKIQIKNELCNNSLNYFFGGFCQTPEHLMDLLNNKIQMIHGVTGTETLISLDHSIAREIPTNYK